MPVLDKDPALLALKSRCTTLETNGNMLEERVKGLQTALNEEIPPLVIQEFRDVSQAVAAESSKIRELAGKPLQMAAPNRPQKPPCDLTD